MTRQQGDRFFVFSLLACLVGAFLAFGLCFQPSWANGWPGVPQRVAWPAGLTALTFALGMCLVIGSGSAVFSRIAGRRERMALTPLIIWSLCGLAPVGLVCLWLYNLLHSAASELWP